MTGDCVRRRARLRRCALTSSCGGSGCNARRSHCCMHVTNSSAPGMRPPAARAIAPAYGQRHPVAFLTSCRGMVQRPETHRRCVRTGSSGATSLRRTTTAMPYARQKQQRAWYAPTSRSCHRIRCHRWHLGKLLPSVVMASDVRDHQRRRCRRWQRPWRPPPPGAAHSARCFSHQHASRAPSSDDGWM